MKEVERKFIPKYIPNKLIKNNIISQGYLFHSDNQYLRIRIIDNMLALLCYKHINSGIYRDEYEYTIPLSDGLELMNACALRVNKTRYLIEENELFKAELDVYLNNIITIDIEYKTDQINYIPDYCGQEVTTNKDWSTLAIAKKLQN